MTLFQDKYIKIITIDEDSLSQVLKVYKQCEDFLALGPEPKATKTMVRNDIKHSKEEKGLYCGVFDLEDNMLGIVDFVPCACGGNNENAFISLIMISKSYRNKGLGTKIIKAVEKYIGNYPKNKAILSAVQTNNSKAIKFWESIGYRIIGEPELRPDKTIVYYLRKDL